MAERFGRRYTGQVDRLVGGSIAWFCSLYTFTRRRTSVPHRNWRNMNYTRARRRVYLIWMLAKWPIESSASVSFYFVVCRYLYTLRLYLLVRDAMYAVPSRIGFFRWSMVWLHQFLSFFSSGFFFCIPVIYLFIFLFIPLQRDLNYFECIVSSYILLDFIGF